MKSNKFWSFLMMFVIMLGSAIAFTSCGGDDDDEIIPNNGSGITGGPITQKNATDKVQSVKIHKAKFSSYLFETDQIPNAEQVIFHQDFKYKYSFMMLGNTLAIVPYALNKSGDMTFHKSIDNGADCGIKDCGKVSSVNDFELPNNHDHESCEGIWYQTEWGLGLFKQHAEYEIAAARIYPSHGYFVRVKTYEDGIKWLRVYIKDYTQDSNGELKDITIDYQLSEAPTPKS